MHSPAYFSVLSCGVTNFLWASKCSETYLKKENKKKEKKKKEATSL